MGKNRCKEDNFIRRFFFFMRSFLSFVRRAVLSEEAPSNSTIPSFLQLLRLDPTVGVLESTLGANGAEAAHDQGRLIQLLS